MKLILATDWKDRKRVLLQVDQAQADLITAHMGYLPPWLVIDGTPVDGKVILSDE